MVTSFDSCNISTLGEYKHSPHILLSLIPPFDHPSSRIGHVYDLAPQLPHLARSDRLDLDTLPIIRLLSGILYQADLLGAPSVSTWNLCRRWMG